MAFYEKRPVLRMVEFYDSEGRGYTKMKKLVTIIE